MDITKILLLLAAAALGGCALVPGVPGMAMNDLGGQSWVEVPVSEPGEPPQTDKVKITPITANLIVNQHRAAPPPPAAQTDAAAAYQYRIGPRDILTITVWDHPELTIPAGEFRSAEAAGHLVGEDGILFYPFVGEIKVTGMTVDQLRRVLTQRLSQYIEDPQLAVRVAAYRSQRIYLVGEVRQPGILPITDIPLTIVEAINVAGGITEIADLRHIILTRDGETRVVDLLALYERGDVSQNLLLRHGDVLHVPDINYYKVFVMGEVAVPSTRLMHHGRMTLAEALSDAGGVDRVTSNPGRIFVIRGAPQNPEIPQAGENQGKPEIFHLDAKSPDALLLAEGFQLSPRDVVYVDVANISRWNRVITQILPTAQTLFQATGTDFPLFQGRNRL